jgi:hypothetical protein
VNVTGYGRDPVDVKLFAEESFAGGELSVEEDEGSEWRVPRRVQIWTWKRDCEKMRAYWVGVVGDDEDKLEEDVRRLVSLAWVMYWIRSK